MEVDVAIVDVAIVGAGPGGSVTALILARHGLRVALLDRDHFPRDKVCGEFLSWDGVAALQALGMETLLDDAGASNIRQGRLFAGKQRLEFELPFPARGLSRYRFDRLLLEQARAAGALVMEGAAVESVQERGSGFALRHAGGELEARAVVGSWGRWGRIDRQLERPFVSNHSTRHFGFKRHYRFAQPVSSIDLYSFDRGYLGVSAVEEGITNVCGLVHEQRIAGMRGRWEGFAGELAKESSSLAALFAEEPAGEFLSSEPVIFSARSAVHERLFLAGDASSMIDPLTGNGMSLALQSAMLVAPYVVRSLEGSSGQAALYAAAHHRLFSSRLQWSRTAARLLKNPSLLAPLLSLPLARSVTSLFVRGTRGGRRTVEQLARALPVRN